MKKQARMGTSLFLSPAAVRMQHSASSGGGGGRRNPRTAPMSRRMDGSGSGSTPTAAPGRFRTAWPPQRGEKVTLPSAQLSVRMEGDTWRFVGWSTSETASLPEYEPGGSFTVGEDTPCTRVRLRGLPCHLSGVTALTTTEKVQPRARPQRRSLICPTAIRAG